MCVHAEFLFVYSVHRLPFLSIILKVQSRKRSWPETGGRWENRLAESATASCLSPLAFANPHPSFPIVIFLPFFPDFDVPDVSVTVVMVIASWREPAEAIMMATTAVVGLAAGSGKRILSSSSSYHCHSDLGDKLFHVTDRRSATASTRSGNCYSGNAIPAVAKRASSSSSSGNRSYLSSGRLSQSPPRPIKAFKERVLHPPSSPIVAAAAADAAEATFSRSILMHDLEEQTSDLEYSLDALLLLQKSMLESQWNLCFEGNPTTKGNSTKKVPVTCSGISARQRRIGSRRRKLRVKQLHPASPGQSIPKPLRSAISPELLRNRLKGYVKGVVSDDLLTHSEVVHLSNKIKAGLSIDEHKSR